MTEGKITLKLVKGERYMSRVIGSGVVVEKGQKIEVDADKAHFLTEDKYVDALGNEHFYFEEVDGDDDGGETKTARARRSKAKPSAPEGDGDN